MTDPIDRARLGDMANTSNACLDDYPCPEDQDELRALIAWADKARAALTDHEWVWVQGDVGPRCLWCRNLREWGHKTDCAQQTVLTHWPAKASE